MECKRESMIYFSSKVPDETSTCRCVHVFEWAQRQRWIKSPPHRNVNSAKRSQGPRALCIHEARKLCLPTILHIVVYNKNCICQTHEGASVLMWTFASSRKVSSLSQRWPWQGSIKVLAITWWQSRYKFHERGGCARYRCVLTCWFSCKWSR